MRQVPKLSIFLSLLLIGIALSFPLQIMYLFGHTAQEWIAIYHKLTNLNFVVIGLTLVNSHLLWRMSPLLKYTIPLMIAAVFWNNYIAGISAINYSFEQSLLGSLAVFLFCGMLLLNPYRELLQNPEKRWWLVPARKQVSVPIRAQHPKGFSFVANTFDISTGGAFIGIPPQLRQNSKSLKNIEVGMTFELNVESKRFEKLQLKAEVVRKSTASGQYPTGIGVRFKSLSNDDRQALKEIMQGASPV